MVVGVSGCHHTEYGVRQLVPVTVQVLVVLLVYSLQLGMETAQHNILETVRLNLCPILQLIAGDILHIYRLVVTGKGITAVTADVSHQLVVFVGNEVCAGLVTDAVYLVIDSLALFGVGRCTIYLIEVRNLIQQHLLLFIVDGTQIGTALEHHVLQIVSQTRCLSWLMFTAGMHSDICLNTGLFLVYCQINFQPVFQRIHLGIQRVILYSLIVILLLTSGKTHNSY